MVCLRCLEGGDVEHLASRQDHDVGQNNLVSHNISCNVWTSAGVFAMRVIDQEPDTDKPFSSSEEC